MTDNLPASIDNLIRELRRAGFDREAGELHALAHEVAWTTSSEMAGEIGTAVLGIQARLSNTAPERVGQAFEESMRLVREIWPDIGLK